MDSGSTEDMAEKAGVIRYAVAGLTISLAGILGWHAAEGDGPIKVIDGQEHHVPYIPVKGDVPTIGHGSTRYEDGTPVRLTDKPITRQRAQELARNLMSVDEKRFRESIPNVSLTQGEYDLYMDFVGQYGIGRWRSSTIRKRLLAGDHCGACEALLPYRFVKGYDCSTLVNGQRNKVCWGVWDRTQGRYAKCIKEQEAPQ